MIRDMLTLTTVQVSRETVANDGMGGTTTTTTLTTLPRAALFQNGSANRFTSDRWVRDSTHTLVCLYADYTWSQDDRQIVQGGYTYDIKGRPEDVGNEEKMITVPLELQT